LQRESVRKFVAEAASPRTRKQDGRGSLQSRARPDRAEGQSMLN
jgi:hypothetical protein